MKQTAVEFLSEQIRLTNIEGLRFQLWDAIEQAKEMEKQQQGYSEEEVVHLLKALQLYKLVHTERIDIEEWFEQFKNK